VDFIKVTTRDGEVLLNSIMIEMIFPKSGNCTIRMNEKFFIDVAESAEEILAMLSKTKK